MKKNRLRVLRAERRVTQLDTAVKVRISENRYWRIENGYDDPTPEEIERLAAFFGVSQSEIFPEPEKSKAATR